MASLKDLIVLGPARFLDKLYGNLEGNAATASKLKTSVAINGTNFDGSSAITTSNWGTARNITIGSKTKSVNGSTTYNWTHAEIGATVSNTWAAGTTAGPKISTTVNGVTGTAVEIPSASTSASGVVTTGAQRFRGVKSLEYPVITSNASRYLGHYYKSSGGTTVGDHWLDMGDASKVTQGVMYWRLYSPKATADTTTGYYEQYYLPAVTIGRSSNASYEIFTSKTYTTLDGRYVNVSGDTMTGQLILSTTVNDHTKPTGQALVINCEQVPSGGTLTDKNAPGIGFHIGNNSWGSLILNSGKFKFVNNTFDGYMPVYASTFYGALSGNATTATSAGNLSINNTASLSNCLQYIQTNTQTSGNDLPTANYWHVLKMNHGTGDTYYKRLLAFDFFSHRIKTNYASGDGAVKEWRSVLDSEYGVARAHYSTTSAGGSTYILVTINKELGWMLNFTLRLYQSYVATDIQISGYNYGSSYWYSPQAVILGSTSNAAQTIYFGYTGAYKLWVAVPAADYTGADVFGATNGYHQIDDLSDAFTITRVSSLPGTTQKTLTCYRPWYRDETVSNATYATSAGSCTGNAATATKLQTAKTIFGRSFNGTSNVEGQVECYGSYTATANQRYYSCALEIRENGLVGNAQSDIGYAPSIGFHWGNRSAATLNYHSDGIFYFIKQNGVTRATIDANVNGWASSAGSATTATKATQDASGNTITTSYLRRHDWWNSGNGNDVDTLRAGITFAYTNHNAPTTGTIVAFDCRGNENYGLQIMGDYLDTVNHLHFRNRDGDGNKWGAWRTVLDDNNYTSYTVTKTGSGASGTWGINVTGSSASCTGNAATATKLAAAKAIITNLASTSVANFDGSGNITPGVSGTLGLGNGGTGATTKSGAKTNLGITYGTTLPTSGMSEGDIFFKIG